MPKELLIEGDAYPLPDKPDAEWLEKAIADCMDSGEVFEISVGKEGERLTKLLINGKALTYAAVREIPEYGSASW